MEDAQRRAINAAIPPETLARMQALLHRIRDLSARQVQSKLGHGSDERLKWEVVLRQYGTDPGTGPLIEEKLRHVPSGSILPGTRDGLWGIVSDFGIRYHRTGGLVTVYYAEPRRTHVAHRVVDRVPLEAQPDEFINALKRLSYLVNPEAVRGRVFPILDAHAGLKINFSPRELVPGALDRAVMLERAPDLTVPIASRPDLMAARLHWISRGPARAAATGIP